jgi:CheY-specific phosphatase CheX
VNEAQETLRHLLERTFSYLIEDMSLELDDNVPLHVQESETVSLLEETALIEISGDINGEFFISLDRNLAKFMVAQFVFGEVTDEEAEELIEGLVAEMLNVVLGNVIQYFPAVKRGGVTNISTPYVIHQVKEINNSDLNSIQIGRIESPKGDILVGFLENE